MLFRNFNQRRELVDAFNQVQLLVSETDVEAYRSTRRDLDRLRSIVEKSELWIYRSDEDQTAKAAAESNFNAIRKYVSSMLFPKLIPYRILIYITELCEFSSREMRLHNQRLLRNLKAHFEIMQLLKMPCQPNDDAIRNIHQKAHKFLQVFCRGNRENQQELIKYVPFFIDQVLLANHDRVLSCPDP